MKKEYIKLKDLMKISEDGEQYVDARLLVRILNNLIMLSVRNGRQEERTRN
jgi:hypothetical protein